MNPSSFRLHLHVTRAKSLAGSFSAFVALLTTLVTTTSVLAQTTVTTNPWGWTDRLGNPHNTWNVNIEFYDEDIAFDDYLGLDATNAGGIASLTFPDQGITEGFEVEMFWQVRAATAGTTHVKENFGDAEPYRKRFPTSGTVGVAQNSSTLGVGGGTVDNTTFTGTGVGMAIAADHVADYYRTTHGASVPFIPLIYRESTDPNSVAKEREDQSAFYPGTEDRVVVGYQLWGSWDVIMHEWSHHIQANNNIGDSPGGKHSFGRDNIGLNAGGRDHGADNGAKLAWGEGTATFMGLMAVDDGNLAGNFSNLPDHDVDAFYDTILSTNSTATNAQTTIRVDAETRSTNTGAFTPGTGEGDELSVLRAMWDIYDDDVDNYAAAGASDPTNFGAAKSWDLLTGTDTFRDYWREVSAMSLGDPTLVGLPGGAKEGQVLSTLGSILQEYSIAGTPLIQGIIPDTTPTLSFLEGNNNNSHQYQILLYDDQWDLVSSFAGANTNAELNTGLENFSATVTNPLTVGDDYFWVALNLSALDGAALPGSLSDWYWSGANMITIVPEPSMLGLLIMGTATVFARREGRSRRSR